MTGEDFSFITEAMPAAYFHLGIGNETVGSTAELHTPTFKMDETVPCTALMKHDAALLCAVLLCPLHSKEYGPLLWWHARRPCMLAQPSMHRWRWNT